ncbi:MAG: GNAT family N-acetyltransferase [Labilithrix sp.]|nr:GNAT family N-acetyltransferase [Labilithrix sp.]
MSASPDVQLVVGQPCERDAQQVMEWRNDPETLRQSLHSTPKRWPAFYDEFRAEYCDDARWPPLFGQVDGRLVGFVRLRRCEDPRRLDRATVEIGVNVAPSERGRNIGTALIRRAAEFAAGQGADVILAEIKPDNRRSISAFGGAGFSRIDEIEKALEDGSSVRVIRYENVLVPVLSLRGADGTSRRLGPGHPVFIIAEAGSNWRMGTPARDRRMAEALIDVAAAAGCDAVKFQTYRPETVYVENAGTSDYLAGAGIKESIRDIFADLAMPYELIPELAAYCEKRKIMFMSTPFSTADFDALDPFVPMHKLASYEISHRRLIEKMAASGKPVIMSTGASTLDDIRWALGHFRRHGGASVALMQCTARYPAPIDALNLEAIPLMRSTFGVPVGLSDHSREPSVGPAAAAVLGAAVIEKHFTLDQRLPGPDHGFAVGPDELLGMVRAVRQAEASRGSGLKTVLPAEDELRAFARRGLQATQPIRRGDILREGTNFDTLRPGKCPQGAHPRHVEAIEGRAALREIEVGHGIELSDVDADV